jgi:hypothetical protein
MPDARMLESEMVQEERRFATIAWGHFRRD